MVESYEKGLVLHGSLAEAINAVMREAKYAKKIKGPGLPYAFLSEEELLEVLRPAMIRHGLSIAPIDAEQIDAIQVQTKSGGSLMMLVRLKVRYQLTAMLPDNKTENMDIAAIGEAADMLDKAAPKAMTSAFKYALRQTFMMASGMDPDRYASQEVIAATTGETAQMAKTYDRVLSAINSCGEPDKLTKYRDAYLQRKLGDEQLEALERAYTERLELITKE